MIDLGSRIYAKSKSDTPFIVASMFTPDMCPMADRLKASLGKFGMSYVIHEVPTVHRSISAKGADDLAYTKQNFIANMQVEYGKPVLYLDIDMVLCHIPDQIMRLSERRIEFSIYNWLADPANVAYKPIAMPCNGVHTVNRFYGYSHSIDFYDRKQLIASGAVQYYTLNARPLLNAWLETIAEIPSVADDESLDFTYNLRFARHTLRQYWLPKEYCRYPFWIDTRPVIDHPQFPAPNMTSEREFNVVAKRLRFNPQSMAKNIAVGRFPRDRLIDTEGRQLIAVDAKGNGTATGPVVADLWLAP